MSADGSADSLLDEMTFFNAIPEDFDVAKSRIDDLGGPLVCSH